MLNLKEADDILWEHDYGCIFGDKQSIYIYLDPYEYELVNRVPALLESYQKIKRYGHHYQREHLLILSRAEKHAESLQEVAVYIFALTLLQYHTQSTKKGLSH